MTILLFGKSGQVAQELQARGTVIALCREDADLSDPQSCAAAIERHKPSAVINAAAYTAVDQAETEEELATRINGAAPAAMARVCAAMDTPFVHISTDYVFDGSGGHSWRPGDTPSPISAYGRSKLAGEQGVTEAGGRYAILRTSWVFSAHGKNFVKTILRLASERAEISVVSDQIGGPTPASALAAASLAMAERLAIDPSKSGIYHLAGAPDVSWAAFAREIIAQSNLECTVIDIPTAEYPTPARRPHNSRLDCQATRTAFGIEQPDWRAELGAVLRDIDDEEHGL